MTTTRRIGFAILGLVLGAIAGGLLGIGGGLAWTTLAETSGFEGYSGFVVAFWMLGGIIIGMIAGLLIGLKKAAS